MSRTQDLRREPCPHALQGSRHPADLANNAGTLPSNRRQLTVIADLLPTIGEVGNSPGNNAIIGTRDEDRTVVELLPVEVHQNRAGVRERRLH